ncbi:MAG: cbb3-type cytochrome oxidase assembly protein CcoS [Bacteroidota bacterium]
MSVLIILLIVSIIVAGGFLLAFLWSLKDGQMDDDFSPSIRILFDEKKQDKSTI